MQDKRLNNICPHFLCLRLALEMEEDIALTRIGDERTMSLEAKETLSHEETWNP